MPLRAAVATWPTVIAAPVPIPSAIGSQRRELFTAQRTDRMPCVDKAVPDQRAGPVDGGRYGRPDVFAIDQQPCALELDRRGGQGVRQHVVELGGVAQVEQLVESFHRDMNMDVTLRVDGDRRPLAPEVSLALYRAAQESLTNVARYAPGAVTRVLLRYDPDETTLTIDDTAPSVASAPSVANGAMTALAAAGGGHGLVGLGERIEHLGGNMHAGATEHGWRVQVRVPT